MGGAAGHMRHPHDAAMVRSGVDLIDMFYNIESLLIQGLTVPNVKIDGINVSFKFSNGQFAVDRGSLKEIDVSGVTIDRIGERFPEGHGMRPAITNLLTIMNTALPNIQSEIQELGLIANPHYFLNTEYVEGTTNAVGYEEDFIAIHGVNAFYEKHSRGDKYRPGDARPVDHNTNKPTKDPSYEVNFNQSAMSTLIDKLNQVGPSMGFKFYGPIPASGIPDVDIDFSDSLNTLINFNATEYLDVVPELSKYKGKSLEQCLLAIDIKPGNYPNYPLLIMNDGKKRNPYHKETYLNILKRNIPLEDIAPPETIENFVKGAILMHATRLLGNSVLAHLTSEIGDMIGDDGGHEGIVIRNPKIDPNPIKITGDFIETGMFGAIAQVMAQNENTITMKEKDLLHLIESLIAGIF